MEISELRDSIMSQAVETQRAVKLLKMSQEAEQVAGNLIEDTVEFSQEALGKYLAEIGVKS